MVALQPDVRAISGRVGRSDVRISGVAGGDRSPGSRGRAAEGAEEGLRACEGDPAQSRAPRLVQ